MDDSFIMLIFTVLVLIFLIWRVVVDVNPEARADDMLLNKLHSMESGLDAYFSSPTAMQVPTASSVGGGLQDWWNSATSSWVSGASGDVSGAPAGIGQKKSTILPTSDVTSYKLLTTDTIPKGALKTARTGATLVKTGIICPANYSFDEVSSTCKGSSGDAVQGRCPDGSVIIQSPGATTQCVYGCSSDTNAVAVEGNGVSCYKIEPEVLAGTEGSDTCPTCKAPPPPPPVLHRSWDKGWVLPEKDDDGNTFCPDQYPVSANDSKNGEVCWAKDAQVSKVLKPTCQDGSHLELGHGQNNKTLYYCAKQDPISWEVIPAPELQQCPNSISIKFGEEFLAETVPTKDHPDRKPVEIQTCRTCDMPKFEKISNDGSLCLMAPGDEVTKGKRRMLQAKGNTRFGDVTSERDVLSDGHSYGNGGCAKQCLDNLACKGYMWAWGSTDRNDWAQCTLLKSLGNGQQVGAYGWNSGKATD